jgi:hypothetical protein
MYELDPMTFKDTPSFSSMFSGWNRSSLTTEERLAMTFCGTSHVTFRAALRLADAFATAAMNCAFLGVADADTTEIVAARIREAIARHTISTPGALQFTRTNVTAVLSPDDGSSS